MSSKFFKLNNGLKVFGNTDVEGIITNSEYVNTSKGYKINNTSGVNGTFNISSISSITISGGIIIGISWKRPIIINALVYKY